MTDNITLTGLVATIPRHLVTTEGLPITSFRLASTQRRFDRAQERWVDGDTNWYTITAFRHLAVNIAGSVKKGERVVVLGRLRVRDWEAGEKAGTNVEIDADAIGHDLSWGTANFMRSIASVVSSPGEPAPSAADSVGSNADAAVESHPAEADWNVSGSDGGSAADSETTLPAVDSVSAPF